MCSVVEKECCFVLLRMSNVDASQLSTIKAQVITWIPHNWMSKCWGFVFVNNGWLVDLLKLRVLQCIIFKFEPASSNALTQRFILLLWVLLCKLQMQNCLLGKNQLRQDGRTCSSFSTTRGKKDRSIWLCNYMIFWWYKLKLFFQ